MVGGGRVNMTRAETIALYKALQTHGVGIEGYVEPNDTWITYYGDSFGDSKYHYRLQGARERVGV